MVNKRLTAGYWRAEWKRSRVVAPFVQASRQAQRLGTRERRASHTSALGHLAAAAVATTLPEGGACFIFDGIPVHPHSYEKIPIGSNERWSLLLGARPRPREGRQGPEAP